MIYIVEDDVSVRRSFEMFLESAGLEYKSFESAESFFSDGVPTDHDLLLLDINLPGISGVDLLGILISRDNHVPVIVITAKDDSNTRETCLKYGVKAFLRKPVDETLIDLIKYHIAS